MSTFQWCSKRNVNGNVQPWYQFYRPRISAILTFKFNSETLLLRIAFFFLNTVWLCLLASLHRLPVGWILTLVDLQIFNFTSPRHFKVTQVSWPVAPRCPSVKDAAQRRVWGSLSFGLTSIRDFSSLLYGGCLLVLMQIIQPLQTRCLNLCSCKRGAVPSYSKVNFSLLAIALLLQNPWKWGLFVMNVLLYKRNSCSTYYCP